MASDKCIRTDRKGKIMPEVRSCRVIKREVKEMKSYFPRGKFKIYREVKI